MKPFTKGDWKVVKPGHLHADDTEYRCVQIGDDEMYTTLELLPQDAYLISAAPNLYTAHIMRDALDHLLSLPGTYRKREAEVKKVQRFFEEYGYKHDAERFGRDAQLIDFVHKYTKAAMEKATKETV